MTVDAAADHVERNYGAATEYERALQELVDDLRKRMLSLERLVAARWQQQLTPVAPADPIDGKPNELLDSWGLLAPGSVGNIEYRAIYFKLAEIVGMQDVEETSASDLLQFAITVLDRFVQHSLDIREKLINLDC